MMLALTGKLDLLHSSDYFFEPKLDGYRALCTQKNGKLKFTSRNGIDLTNDFPELNFSLKKDCIIDGEIVMYDEKGNPSFSLMQRRSINHKNHASYVAFDILEVDGKDVKHLKLSQRKELLLDMVKTDAFIQVIPSTEDGTKLWDVVVSRKLEGVMAKRKDSKYSDGRSKDWLKIKNELTLDCIIVGYKTKVRKIASLSLGLFENGMIKYIGQVGTGFTEIFLKQLEELLRPIKENTAVSLPRDIIPVHPEFVCEVKYIELTPDLKLRAPVFLKLRDDKIAEDCTIDQVIPYA